VITQQLYFSSFQRKLESSSALMSRKGWIRACAGMTELAHVLRT
jgi:hypothetical protein